MDSSSLRAQSASSAVDVPSFPGSVGDERSVIHKSSSTSQAEHERKKDWLNTRAKLGITYLFVAMTILLTLTAGTLVWRSASAGSPEEKKLAFGVIGTVLGLLWSHVGKMVDSLSKTRD